MEAEGIDFLLNISTHSGSESEREIADTRSVTDSTRYSFLRNSPHNYQTVWRFRWVADQAEVATAPSPRYVAG